MGAIQDHQISRATRKSIRCQKGRTTFTAELLSSFWNVNLISTNALTSQHTSGLLISVCKLVWFSGNVVAGPSDRAWVVYGWAVIGYHRQVKRVHLQKCHITQSKMEQIFWTWRRHRIPVKHCTWPDLNPKNSFETLRLRRNRLL